MKTTTTKLIGYDSSLEFDKQLKAKEFCTIANKQVIPLFKALELELNEKDIKAAVTSRKTAKELYVDAISNTTPKKDKGILRKLMLSTAASEFDEQVAKYGTTTKQYNYDCFYNAETEQMEVNEEKIHDAAAIVLQGDILSAYERVEAVANAINAVCGGVSNKIELNYIIRTLEVRDERLVPTLELGLYEDILEICETKACSN